jgi:hypothetical protein
VQRRNKSGGKEKKKVKDPHKIEIKPCRPNEKEKEKSK